MADRDWVAYWAASGKELSDDQQIPGNGYLPPFSLERAESLGLTVDGNDADGGAVVAEAPAEDVAGADEAPEASEDDAVGFAPTA